MQQPPWPESFLQKQLSRPSQQTSASCLLAEPPQLRLHSPSSSRWPSSIRCNHSTTSSPLQASRPARVALSSRWLDWHLPLQPSDPCQQLPASCLHGFEQIRPSCPPTRWSDLTVPCQSLACLQ